MHKNFSRVMLSLMFNLLCHTLITGQMTTDGRFLYTEAHEKVILRGVNQMTIWLDRDGSVSFPEIKKTGANSVRIVWTTSGSADQLHTALRNCIINDMIPIIECHDATGDWSKFQDVVDYWLQPEITQVLIDHQAYTILNIANEPDGGISNEQWRDTYKITITSLRKAGLNMPLMIDGTDWGKKWDPIKAYGQELIDHDPLNNLMFSVHCWWPAEWGFSDADITNMINDAVTLNLPLVVGEFAHKAVGCLGSINYKLLMQECQDNQVGWLAWSWGPGNQDCTQMDMTTNSYYNTLQGWGLEVAVTDSNSITNTSVTPVSIENMVPGPLPEPQYSFENNLAVNKPVTVSSIQEASFEGSKAVDESQGTRWSSSSTDWQPTITIDLQSAYDINEIILDWEAAYATQYKVEVSADSSTWSTLFNVSNGTGGVVKETVSGYGQYIRMVASAKINLEWGVSLYEFIVKGNGRDTITPSLVDSVSISPATATLSIGDNLQLAAIVSPSNATNRNVSWSSSNTSVATVNSSGLVTGVAEGSAYIMVTTQDGGFIATSSISVSPNGPGIYNDTDLNFSSGWNYESGLTDGRYQGDEHYTFTQGSSFSLTFSGTQISLYGTRDAHHGNANVSIDGKPGSSISYYSANRSVDQLIWTSPLLSDRAHKIEVTSSTNAVIVVDKVVVFDGEASIPVTGVSVSPTSASLNINDVQQLTASVFPANASNQNVNWSSDNPFVATVDSSGLLTAIAEGTATITITTEDGGYTATNTVSVSEGSSGSVISIVAEGNCGSEDMRLLINDIAVATWYDIGTDITTKTYNNYSDGTIKVEFFNDGNDGCDRNLRIDYIQIDGVDYQAEDQEINTGVWQEQCGGSYAEWLHCAGFIDFGNIKSNSIYKNAHTEGILIAEEKPSGFVVYPNPTKDFIKILGDGAFSLTLFNFNGQAVLSRENLSTDFELDVRHLQNGLYIMKIKTDNFTETKQIIIN